MARRLVWTLRARDDLEAIGTRIAEDDPRAAERWVGILIKAVEHTVRFPMLGRRVPERDRDEVREVIKGSYRIVYRVSTSSIDVLTVFEGHLPLPDDVDDG